MRGEMYVAQMIIASNRARDIVSGHFGNSSIKYFYSKDALKKLSRSFKCDESEAFERLANQLEAAFGKRKLPILTRNSIGQLRNPKVQFALSQIFRCHPSQVLELLFDSEAVRRTIATITPSQARVIAPSVESLLIALLQPSILEHIERRRGLDPNDWEVILEEDNWFRHNAIVTLHQFGNTQSIITQHTSRLLANIIEETLEQRFLGKFEFGTSLQVLDWLALTSLRQQFQWIIEQMRGQALEFAQSAAHLSPNQPILARLPIWLELYERGAILNTLPQLIELKQPLSNIIVGLGGNITLPNNLVKRDIFQSFHISDYKRFPVRKGLFGNDGYVVSFMVMCRTSNSLHQDAIVQINALPEDIASKLIRSIENISLDELSLIGDRLSEQLLNTLVIQPDAFLQYLSEAVLWFGPSLIQCFVLCGSRHLADVDPFWNDNLSETIPYRNRTTSGDTSFPKSSQDIKQDLTEQYKSKGVKLNIIVE